MNISINLSYFDLDWGKLDIVRPGFGFVDNYLSKMWRFNQLGKFLYWIDPYLSKTWINLVK